jgi:hypothetical protein
MGRAIFYPIIFLTVALLAHCDAGAQDGSAWVEITAGTFDAPYQSIPGTVPPTHEDLYPSIAPEPIQPYDDMLIQTAPGQIESEDGYRIWVLPATTPEREGGW